MVIKERLITKISEQQNDSIEQKFYNGDFDKGSFLVKMKNVIDLLLWMRFLILLINLKIVRNN